MGDASKPAEADAMKADQKRDGAWRQIRIVHALIAAALADPAKVDPEMVLDEITDVACLTGVDHGMNEQLAALEAMYVKR
jgi:hypothetical protein